MGMARLRKANELLNVIVRYTRATSRAGHGKSGEVAGGWWVLVGVSTSFFSPWVSMKGAGAVNECDYLI